MKIRLNKLVFLCIVLILACEKTAIADIGAELNPTGNPIGGGPGYSDSVFTYDYYVTNKTELLNALSNASSGDVIYVADYAEINMGNTQHQVIPAGVTLASGRGRILEGTISWGGLIYTNEHDEEIEYLFRTGGSNVRITGLRIQGPDPEVGDRLNGGIYHRQITGIQLQHNNAEIDNCEIFGWPRAGIQVTSTISSEYRAHIHHNHIHHNRGAGLGYGVVMSGNSDALIEANYFDFCRHYVASTGDITQSYEACWNISGRHGNYHGLDRHGSGQDGGKLTLLHHNTLKNTAPQHCHGVSVRGVPVDTARINNNWFWQPDSASAIYLISNENVTIYDNHFDTLPSPGISDLLPVAVIDVNTDYGEIPLSVSFDGTDSYDNDGSINWYEWTDADGSTKRDSLMNHTYNEVGIYKAGLTVFDNDGIEDIEYVDIIAAPNVDSQFLSLWVKDSYRDDAFGFFSIQILIDSDIIWEQDVAGDSGWMHIVENVTSNIGEKDSVTITLRVYCNKDMTGEFKELEVYFDDVALFWGDVRNGDFEDDESNYWVYDYCTGFLSSGYFVSEDVRSGNRAYMITQQYETNCYQGNWAKVEQKIGITEGIEDGNSSSGEMPNLLSPYPNPSVHGSLISYNLPSKSKVCLKIYDISGRLVKTLVNEIKGAGEYQINWDGLDTKGKAIAGGVYFIKFTADVYNATKKLLILR
jgi:PKD repeat protein